MSKARAPGVFVALLRGINVGKHNRLPMKDLARMFEESECVDVHTFIASGNVVFSAPARVAKNVPGAVGAAIQERFGFEPAIIVRSGEDLAAVSRSNPFLPKADPDELHVGFLSGVPDAKIVATLDPRRSPPDEFVVKGREIYFRYPNGLGRSKLAPAYFERVLGLQSTVRNWRTVSKLVEMCSA